MWGSIASKLPRHEPERHLLAYGNHRLEVLMYDLLTRKTLEDAFRPTSTVQYKFRLTKTSGTENQRRRTAVIVCILPLYPPRTPIMTDIIISEFFSCGLKPYIYVHAKASLKTTLNTQLAWGHGRQMGTNSSWMKTLFDQQYLARRKMGHALACGWCKTLCTMNIVTALCACGRLINNLPQLDWPICSGSMAKT